MANPHVCWQVRRESALSGEGRRLPDLAGRAVLVLLLLFLACQASRAHVADEASALLFTLLGLFCVTATLLASPRGAVIATSQGHSGQRTKGIVGGTIVRMTRTRNVSPCWALCCWPLQL